LPDICLATNAKPSKANPVSIIAPGSWTELERPADSPVSYASAIVPGGTTNNARLAARHNTRGERSERSVRREDNKRADGC
jgi:hypothetical protein